MPTDNKDIFIGIMILICIAVLVVIFIKKYWWRRFCVDITLGGNPFKKNDVIKFGFYGDEYIVKKVVKININQYRYTCKPLKSKK